MSPSRLRVFLNLRETEFFPVPVNKYIMSVTMRRNLMERESTIVECRVHVRRRHVFIALKLETLDSAGA